jgi:protein-disulfide isomerase
MRLLMPFLLALVLTACAAAPTSTPTTPPTLVPPTPTAETFPTPLPTSAAFDAADPAAVDRYAGLPQTIAEEGFPRLGFPSAPVKVVLYAGFDDLASGQFFRDSFGALLTRIRAGEVELTFVPVSGRGTLPGGRGAARAALCVLEQAVFWRFFDTLFTWQGQYGEAAFEGSRLLDGADGLGLDRRQWDACMISETPDALVSAGDRSAAAQPNFTNPPFVLINGVPSLTDADSLNASIDMEARRIDAAVQATLAANPEATPVSLDPEATDEPLVVTLEPLMGEQITPPLTLDLPEGWRAGYDTLVLQDIDAIRNIPFAVYSGPVEGGTGTIVLLWGFPNLVAGNPFEQTQVEVDLWSDGLRLLRLAIVEESCNIGTDLRRQYAVGGLTATGTQFSAVDCPELADTRGWFAGLRQLNINFVFYAFTEPISAMETGRDQLQAILDTVQFTALETPAGG